MRGMDIVKSRSGGNQAIRLIKSCGNLCSQDKRKDKDFSYILNNAAVLMFLEPVF